MEKENSDRINRILGMYTKLVDGYVVNKSEAAIAYGVNEKSIQRDINTIRDFLDLNAGNQGFVNSIVYDREKKGYRLEQVYKVKLSNSEILAICKILLDSRAFTKKEMEGMMRKLVECCVPKSSQKLVTELIRNEEFHYIEPRHKTVFMDKMWEIGQAIQGCKYIEIDYQKMKGGAVVTRRLKPLAIMFSEYYFYLLAFIDDESVWKEIGTLEESSPTIYRIDRIKKLEVLEEHFHIPYSSRFEEGKFRKRVQFMYGGKLRRVKFKYKGLNIEAVLDRLPTAQILEEKDGVYLVMAEVFGDGIDMWLRSQGDTVEVVE